MFEKLIDALVGAWDRLRPVFIVRAWESGVLLRFGKFSRVLQPGFHWKWPLIDEPIEVTACITTVRLPAQPLTTKDDVQITVASIVKYEIIDPEPYVTKIFDQHDVLTDVGMGAIRRLTAASTYAELVANPPEAEVLASVRKEVNKYGFKVHAVTFTAFTRARPLMLINQNPLLNLDN